PEVQRYGDTLELSSQVPVPNTEIVLNLNERMSINVNTQHYYIGPSIGIRFADFLGVGVSIFGVYAVDLIDSN
ncbi:MAG: hypothetical protein FJ088_07995, partial [Deltaproteobacteria bacterium]|nr:hypothetical protein [Deltaproteobacteria bacterium]